MIDDLDSRFRGNDDEEFSTNLQGYSNVPDVSIIGSLYRAICDVWHLLFGGSAHEEKSEAAPAQSTAKQKAKKVYTNEDLKSLKDTTRVNQTSSNQSSAEGRETALQESRAIATRQAMTVSIGKRGFGP